MSENYYAVIMAGGEGSRLWPLSRRARPKQMLPLIEERTLFQTALHRLSAIFPPERIRVVTSPAQGEELMRQATELDASSFLLEPEPRGTAAAIGLAAAALQAENPEAVMAVLTADHYIGDEERFHQYLLAAEQIAEEGALVTLGIETEYGATQYGYIHKGDPYKEVSGFDTYKVARFKEKPQEAEAQELHDSGEYAWNSGMFIWRAESIMQAFENHMPKLHAGLVEIAAAWGGERQQETLEQVWPTVPHQTIDYGVMEHAENVVVIPAKDMRWNDVGNFPALFDVLGALRDEAGNLDMGQKTHKIATRNSLVHSNGSDRLIVTIGVDDLVVIDTGDVLMICSREHAADVRLAIRYLKENDMDSYL
jgi:mannose-1-phosphate guanylyltransferase